MAVPDFGAGALVEIRPAGASSFYVPFTREAVPRIDIASGEVTVVPPEDHADEESDEAET